MLPLPESGSAEATSFPLSGPTLYTQPYSLSDDDPRPQGTCKTVHLGGFSAQLKPALVVQSGGQLSHYPGGQHTPERRARIAAQENFGEPEAAAGIG